MVVVAVVAIMVVVMVVVLRLLVELWVGGGRRVSMRACIVMGVSVGVRVSVRVWLCGGQGLGGGCVPASFAAPASHLLAGCGCCLRSE